MKRPYKTPLTEVVRYAPLLNDGSGNSYGNNEGWLGFGSGYIDIGKAQAKQGGFFYDEEDDAPGDSSPAWRSPWEE